MRHIQLFEDYSDEELRDLQDDLHGIGHKSKFVQGEDFGFGNDLHSDNNGNIFLFVTEETLKFLIDRGEFKDLNPTDEEEFRFSDPQKWGIVKTNLQDPYFFTSEYFPTLGTKILYGLKMNNYSE